MDESAEHAVRQELVVSRDEARRSIHRGVVMIGMIPGVVIACAGTAFLLGPFSAFLSLVLAGAYTLIGGIAGLASIAGGLVEHRRAQRELRALDDIRKLPEARLLR